MDENNNSAFYNPLGNFTNDQKKTLFTNTRNPLEKKSSADFYTNQNSLGYLPQRSSKLWNHITTKPRPVNPQSAYYSPGEYASQSSSYERLSELAKAQKQEDKSDFNYLDKAVETGSDIFSDNEEKAVSNRLQSVTLGSPATSKELQPPKVAEDQTVPEPLKVEPPFEKKSYAEERVEKLYETIFDDKYPEIKHEDLFAQKYNAEKQKEKINTMYNAVLNIQDHLNSVTTEDTIKYTNKQKYNSTDKRELAPITPDKQEKGPLSNVDWSTPAKSETEATGLNVPMELKGITWVDHADEVLKELEETTPQITKLQLTNPEVNTNPFDTPSPGVKPETKPEPQKERSTSRSHQSNWESYTRSFNKFRNDYANDIVAYSNLVDYNPFTVFTPNRKTQVTEVELNRLKGIIISGNIKEEALIKYFTESMSITNEEMMRQIVDFLLGLMRENHKVRQFVVRLLLCALSIHPEEFISTFKVEYLEALFTPQIDDTTGIYFLRLLLSYKSTFNSKSEVTNNIPYSVNAEGRLLYSETLEESDLKKREGFRDGKLETIYILKILTQRSRVKSVFELPNTILREHLCIIWYEMPKTIPKINIVEILLHWINSKETLETKKYPFLLLERVRDMHPFPKGNMLLMSHFFLFALKEKAKVNSNMEYLITLISTEPKENELINQSQRSTGRSSTQKSRSTYRTESIRSNQRGSLGMGTGEEGGGNRGDVLGIVMYNILNHFNENDLIDLWCLVCTIPWKVTSPTSPFSKLFSTTLTTILKVTSLNYENYNATFKDNKVRLDILENCMRICLVRCSSPINALNALLQTSLLLNPMTEGGKEYNRAEGTGVGIAESQDPKREASLLVECLYKNGMVLNSLCTFLWKCHFLWTRIKEGVNIEVVIVLTELYKLMANYTTVKPLDTNYEFNTHNLSNQIYNFFNNYKANGVWTKITTFLPQINLDEYFEPRPTQEPSAVYDYTETGQYYYEEREKAREEFDAIPEEEGEYEYLVEEPLSEERRTVGLKNLGNSCYLNSLIQALYHTKFFVYNLMLFYEKHMENETVKSIVSLFEKMRNTDKKSLKPRRVFKILTNNLSNSQQDVTEAIRFISEAIDPNLELWKSVFAGLVVRRIKCLRCETMSDNEETMYDFSLALNKAKTVQQMLDNFSKVETLSGENKYFCLNCNKDVKAEMWNVIASPPSHLIVILNRNQWNSNETRKVLKRIKINSELYISGFQYKLYGSIIHSGSSVQSGHYYFIGCDSESFTNWHKIDDSTITSSHEKEIDAISRDSSNTHVPYVLLYRCLQAPQTPKF